MSKSITQAQAIKHDLAKMKDQFRSALPSHISVDKFVRTVQTAISTAPNLVTANRQSLFGATMRAAQDGLLPDGREAAIVTFKNKQGENIANYMPMVGGILKKIRNSGELASITSQIVYENDEFEFHIDENGEHLKHKPIMFGDRGKKIGAYALAKTKDGACYVEVMSMDEINAVKNASRSKSGPWSGPFAGEMIKKTTIKRLSKRLPMSTDLEFTMRADDDLYELDNTEENKEIKDVDTSSPQRLSKLITKEAPNEIVDIYDGSKNDPPGGDLIPEEEVPV